MTHEEACQGPSSPTTDDTTDLGARTLSEAQNRDKLLHHNEQETVRAPGSNQSLSLSQSGEQRPSVLRKFVPSQDETSSRQGAHRQQNMDNDDQERYAQNGRRAHGSVIEEDLPYVKTSKRDAFDEEACLTNSHPFIVTCAQVGQISCVICLGML
jgi:hypothetical protein